MDGTSWWMSGTRNCLFFFVLFRGTVHGSTRLQKMAGDLKEHICVVPSIARPGVARRVVEFVSPCLPFLVSWVCSPGCCCCSPIVCRVLLVCTAGLAGRNG